MTPGLITKTFGSKMKVPMVDERFGRFQNIRIPVQKTPGPANWWLARPGDAEYLTPQTQEEHNKLLNTYYSSRLSNPRWKEMGRIEERKSPHYSDKDNRLRKNLGARSSFVTDIVYDPETSRAMIQLGGGKYYTYAATPNQLKAYMRAGSLGKEINRIKHGEGSSLKKTAARQSPNNSGLNIRSLFGV